MQAIQEANGVWYSLEGVGVIAPNAIVKISDVLYNSTPVQSALSAGDIVDADAVEAPAPSPIPHQFRTAFPVTIRSGATATELKLQFTESLGGFEDSGGNLYDAGDTFITFRVELIDENDNYLLWEGLQGEDPGDGSVALTLTNNENFRSGKSYPSTLGAGGGEYDLTDATADDFIVTAEVSGGGLEFQQTVTVAKAGGEYTAVQSAIDSIPDAASDKIYTVLVYPGEYDEAITLSNYVNIVAVDPKATKILQQVMDNNVECHCYLNITIASASGSGLRVQHASSVIEVDGDISSDSNAAMSISNGDVTVRGNVSALLGASQEAVYMSGGAEIKVTGDILSEDAAVATITVTATATGTLVIRDSEIIVPYIIQISDESAGGLDVKNCIITNNYNNANGHGLTIGETTTGDIVLQNTRIVCTHADATSIYAADAKDAYCMGVWANRDDHANITQKITGGFTFDVDVQ